MEYLYFKAGGESLKVCQEIMRLRQAACKARRSLSRKHGFRSLIDSRGKLVGVKMDDKTLRPEGFVEKNGFLVPDGRTVAGRCWRNTLAEEKYYIPGAADFTTALGHHGWMVPEGGRFTIYYAGYENFGKQMVIRIPPTDNGKPNRFVPKGATQIKASRYWIMREQLLKKD